jgi:hypothetical protein
LKTRDLRCFISSSGAEELGLEEVFDFVDDLAGPVDPLVDFLRDFVVGGVASIKTDISESL